MDTACNIGPAQRQKRLWFGLPLIALGGVASFVTTSWVAPFATFLGFLGLFQARAGTCVALAVRGARNMDAGPQPVDDPADVALFKQRALIVASRSLLATVAVLVLGRMWLRYSRG